MSQAVASHSNDLDEELPGISVGMSYPTDRIGSGYFNRFTRAILEPVAFGKCGADVVAFAILIARREEKIGFSGPVGIWRKDLMTSLGIKSESTLERIISNASDAGIVHRVKNGPRSEPKYWTLTPSWLCFYDSKVSHNDPVSDSKVSHNEDGCYDSKVSHKEFYDSKVSHKEQAYDSKISHLINTSNTNTNTNTLKSFGSDSNQPQVASATVSVPRKALDTNQTATIPSALETKVKHKTSAQPSEDFALGNPKPKQKADPLKGFDEWWEIYPRKVSKGDAERAYPKAVASIAKDKSISADEAIDLLLQLTKERTPELASREPKFIPHPPSWLNRKGYYDEIAKQKPTTNSQGEREWQMPSFN